MRLHMTVREDEQGRTEKMLTGKIVMAAVSI
jgi:hypothetical protein